MRPGDTELAGGGDTVDLTETPNSLKVEINNLIWMHGPDDLTLGEAEKLACRILDGINKGRL